VKKELFVHFSFLISFLIFTSLIKGWINLSYWPFWVGGVVGTLLPDLDHLIYIFFLRPYELTSQRATRLISEKEVVRTLELLAETRYERKDLIFHTLLFQLIFLILTFWIITSSGSLFGRGLVLAFSLHLVIDQIVDLMETGGLTNWSKNIPLVPSKENSIRYCAILLVLILIFGIIL
jgi:hypothetical protein